MVKIDIMMPTYCYDCPCHNGENGRCNITGDYVFDRRPFDCPLREDKSTADVEEVKHGEWINEHWEEHPTRGGEWLHTCSNCNTEIRVTIFDHYCPNCGAKMDGKESGDGELL